MIAIMNLMVIGGLVALYLSLEHFGIEFAAGYLLAAVLFHIAYYKKHGKAPD